MNDTRVVRGYRCTKYNLLSAPTEFYLCHAQNAHFVNVHNLQSLLDHFWLTLIYMVSGSKPDRMLEKKLADVDDSESFFKDLMEDFKPKDLLKIYRILYRQEAETGTDLKEEVIKSLSELNVANYFKFLQLIGKMEFARRSHDSLHPVLTVDAWGPFKSPLLMSWWHCMNWNWSLRFGFQWLNRSILASVFVVTGCSKTGHAHIDNSEEDASHTNSDEAKPRVLIGVGARGLEMAPQHWENAQQFSYFRAKVHL